MQTDFRTFAYGADPETQFIRYYKSSGAKNYVIAIIHGGYWKKKYGVDSSGIDSLVPYLLRQGYGVCLIEYRRVGHEGGGWPGTNNDVLEGLWKLRSVLSVDYGSTSSGSQKSEATAQQSVVLLGHSAGGTLALWIASKLNKLSEGVPIALCVAVAPIGDLNEGSRRKLSDEGDAINLYMGCEPSATSPDCPYRSASPHHLLPLKVPTLLAIGSADLDVPPDMLVSFHEKCVSSCAPSVVPPALLVIPDADHYKIMNAEEDAWLELFRTIEIHLN